MTAPDNDPFAASESAPSLSFKDEPVGTVKKVTVSDAAAMAQQRVYGTQDLAFWPDGNPKMAAVVNGTLDSGEPVAVWAPKPSSLFTAIADAQKAIGAGYRLKAGDVLAVKLDGHKESGKGNPQNLFKAKITPAPEPVAADAFGGDEAPF